MGEKQVTTMVLKVDLECCRCYKKIKKVLCKFPQIQDQVYDKKQNTVTIKVVCCSLEKIKQKIICKAGDTLKSIEIKVPEKPKPTEQKPDKPATSKPPSASQAPPVMVPCVPGYHPLPPPIPRRTCCTDCYEGRPGGPCCYGFVPPGRPPCCQYDWCYGRPVNYSYRGFQAYCTSRCDYFFEENTGACSIM